MLLNRYIVNLQTHAVIVEFKEVEIGRRDGGGEKDGILL